MISSDLTRALFEAYAAIDPRDLRDTEVHISAATARELAASMIGTSFEFEDYLTSCSTLLGITVRRDDDLPYGEFRFITENAQERALRRTARDGITVNVVKREPFLPMALPAPTPTVKALAKHWWKKIRR